MFYVYVLKIKKDKKFYIGFTSNLKLRFQEHDSGRVNSTSYRRPFELIYYEAYKSEKIAKERERRLKSGKMHMALKKRLAQD